MYKPEGDLILTPEVILSPNCLALAHHGPYNEGLSDAPTQDERHIEDDKHREDVRWMPRPRNIVI